MEKYLHDFNEIAKAYVNAIENADLREGARYALFPGGKRLRPLLMLATLADLGADYRLGLYPAFGLEMIHTYSLIHDDLPPMDDDDHRRGKPSLHRAFGEALAILVGDALLTDAFLMFSKAPLSPERIVLLVELAARAAGSGGMVRGQVLDLKNGDRCLGALEEIILGKTAALFRLALVGAGIIAGREELDDLAELAHWFGLAFQIKDDIADFETENKITHPVLLGMEEARNKFRECREKSLRIAGRILGKNEVYHLLERIL